MRVYPLHFLFYLDFIFPWQKNYIFITFFPAELSSLNKFRWKADFSDFSDFGKSLISIFHHLRGGRSIDYLFTSSPGKPQEKLFFLKIFNTNIFLFSLALSLY
jgi:hypothetical protein